MGVGIDALYETQGLTSSGVVVVNDSQTVGRLLEDSGAETG